MSKSRHPLSQERWAYLKALKAPPGRVVHQSCEAYMIQPTAGPGLPWVPYIQKPGVTYKLGRNKARRARNGLARLGLFAEGRKCEA